MKGIENKTITLVLNKNWTRIGYKSVKDAFIALCGGADGENYNALSMDYELDENGQPLYNQPSLITPVAWEEWVTLPIRPWDFSISTAKMTIRVPTVIIAKNYDAVPKIQHGNRPNLEQIYKRDGGRCQYSGVKLAREEATMDHVIPRAKGGKDTWDNLVTCAKDLNHWKGSKLNEEVGLRLLTKPAKPKSVFVSETITVARHPDWEYFIK